MTKRNVKLSDGAKANLQYLREYIRWVRQELGLSATGVAVPAGLHRNTLYQFETGEQSIGLENLLAVVHQLGYEVVLIKKTPSF